MIRFLNHFPMARLQTDRQTNTPTGRHHDGQTDRQILICPHTTQLGPAGYVLS